MSAADMIALALAWVLAVGSPGPATLGILSSAMTHGSRAALQFTAGILCGSMFWGLCAGLGLGAVMIAHPHMLGALRYIGATYLLWLAFKAARRARAGTAPDTPENARGRPFLRGLLIHLTNPKAVLAWGAVYSVALGPNAPLLLILEVFLLLFSVSVLVCCSYALLFSRPAVARAYRRMHRLFDAAFAAAFGGAGIALLTARAT